MPPRRASKTTKGLKENIGVVEKTKLKHVVKVTKPIRKALADKTNSASDDNTSIEHPNETAKKTKITRTLTNIEVENVCKERPRRDRRLPRRFVENHVLKNWANSKENASLTAVSNSNEAHTPLKDSVESPLKIPQKVKETSLVASRPRRVCRLPSKFEELCSPNKSVTIEPDDASTPLVLNSVKNSKVIKSGANDKPLPNKKSTQSSMKIINNTNKESPSAKSKESHKKTGKVVSRQSCADTNNNAKQGRTLRSKRTNTHNIVKVIPTNCSPTKSATNVKSVGPKHKNGTCKRPLRKNLSFIVLDDKKRSGEGESNLDVYEFTYDPNEEPPPQKKKKRVVKKKPAKVKAVIFKNNYDQNLSKALNALKSVVSQKSNQEKNFVLQKSNQEKNVVLQKSNQEKNVLQKSNQEITNDVAKSQQIAALPTTNGTYVDTVQPSTSGTFKIPEQHHASVRIEDIAADFEPFVDHYDINYSPINSPNHVKTPIAHQSITEQSTERQAVCNNDPLNLQDNLSFFDDEPVASSSMYISAKHPHASPWRVEFQNLPIKWRVNSYVKSNMTPAMECSFVNFDDNKKKHVYTNIVPEDSDPMPEIVQNNEPNLRQTSIISFIKEVVDRNASKKKHERSTTPNRANLYDNVTSITVNKLTDKVHNSPRKVLTLQKSVDLQRPLVTSIHDYSKSADMTNETDNTSHDRENSKETKKHKNDSDPDVVPAKVPCKDKDNTFFGFDDSENENNENVSPCKPDRRVRDLRPRARTVLKEINARKGPTRAMIPIAPKSQALNSEAVTKLYEEMTSTADAPVFPEKGQVENVEATNANEAVEHETVVDEPSVHLFEDIEFIHHLKPTRKSYGKAKKVTFRQRSLSNSDTQDSDMPGVEQVESGEEDDLADLTFEIPTVKEKRVTKKKMTKKQKQSKKELQEAEEWAAGFNSMCEDVEDFPLVVE